VLPKIIKVAAPAAQHSPIFGHLPLSQIVCKQPADKADFIFEYTSAEGNVLLSHLGFVLKDEFLFRESI
jgi:hypothetical protein